jgi:hypothetical protein
MKNEKYPCIFSKSGQLPKEYIGIMYNGDQGVYRKATIKALKKAGESKEIIKAVKAADGDLETSKILIEADLFDILVDVFNISDSRTAVWDYIDNLYQSVVDEANTEFSSITADFTKLVSELDGEPDIQAILAENDKTIVNRTEELLKKLFDLHEETAKTVYQKYQEALKKHLDKLKKELQAIRAEKARLEALI